MGTATFVTDYSGSSTQFFLNLPFGETMVEQRTGAFDNWYRFNAKELDKETNLYYYGARYYNPSLSIWYGVDPLAEKFPEWSPYVYTFDNPINLIDPDGREPGPGPMWNHYSVIGLRGYSQVSFQSKTNPDPWTINTFFGSVNLQNPTAVNAHILHVGNEDFMFSSHQQMAIYANAIDWDTFDATREVQFNSTSNYQGNTYQIGERPVTLTDVRDNITAIQELSCNCGAVLMGAMGASRLKTPDESAAGGKVISRGQTNAGDPRTVVQKGNKTFDITAERVKEYTKNSRNPNSRYGDAVNFKKYGTPKGSEIIQGAGKGHKRTPTAGELKMLKK